MGGQQSTRRITVLNDEASGVIKISDSVVQRLKDEIRDNSASQQQQQPEQPPAPASPPPTTTSPPQDLPQTTQQQEPGPVHQRPVVQYIEREPSMSALKIRAEKERELADADAYWKDRLRKLEHDYSVMSNLRSGAYDETMKKLDERLLKSRRPPICEDARKGVIQCYQTNKSSSLNCSQEVKNFSKCVEANRIDFLTRSG